MLLRPDYFRMISSATHTLVTGAIDVAIDERSGPAASEIDPGDTVRLPIVERPIHGALLGALR